MSGEVIPVNCTHWKAARQERARQERAAAKAAAKSAAAEAARLEKEAARQEKVAAKEAAAAANAAFLICRRCGASGVRRASGHGVNNKVCPRYGERAPRKPRSAASLQRQIERQREYRTAQFGPKRKG